MTGLDKEPDKPVILDLESVRVLKPGKFEIDIVNLFSKEMTDAEYRNSWASQR